MNTNDCLDAAASYLATEPAAVDRALRTHRLGANGRCAGCGLAAVSWPCVVAISAQRAHSLLHGRSKLPP